MDDNADEARRDDKGTSRRAVLKAAGVATVGSLVAAAAPASVRASGRTKSGPAEQPVVPPDLIERALKAALESPLVKREVEQLQ